MFGDFLRNYKSLNYSDLHYKDSGTPIVIKRSAICINLVFMAITMLYFNIVSL